METMQQSQAKAQRRDFAKPVAGVQVGDSHYSIREVGYYFGEAKIVTARFFMARVLPQTVSLNHQIKAGASTLMALPADAF